MASALDSQIDALYQLPLEQFTQARNALAKTLSEPAGNEVRALPKPSLPAWIVNQLHWNDRPTYAALIDASEKLRTAHRAIVSGHQADVRKPEQLHRAALERAVARISKASGQEHVPAATGEAVRRILLALPNEVQAGRLVREPEAAGFDLLAGVTPRAIRSVEPRAPRRPHTPVQPQPSHAREIAQAKRELRDAGRALAANAADAKRITARLKLVSESEARHQTALDTLARSREALEAQRAHQEIDARRLASRKATAEQILHRRQ